MAKYQFVLKSGIHQDENGKYKPGDKINTDVDLVKRFGAKKFTLVRVNEPTSVQSAAEEGFAEALPPVTSPAESQGDEYGLSEMTVAQLRKFAEDNDIELEGATRKDEIVNTIRAALDQA